MIRALVVLILLALIVPALGHSWYPDPCCSDRDCAPMDPKRVQVTPEGYRIDGGRDIVPFSKALWSPDEHYHGCFPKSMQGRVGCFWAPRQAM